MSYCCKCGRKLQDEKFCSVCGALNSYAAKAVEELPKTPAMPDIPYYPSEGNAVSICAVCGYQLHGEHICPVCGTAAKQETLFWEKTHAEAEKPESLQHIFQYSDPKSEPKLQPSNAKRIILIVAAAAILAGLILTIGFLMGKKEAAKTDSVQTVTETIDSAAEAEESGAEDSSDLLIESDSGPSSDSIVRTEEKAEEKTEKPGKNEKTTNEYAETAEEKASAVETTAAETKEESTAESTTDVMENLDNAEESTENIESTVNQTDIEIAPEITETNDPFYGVWIAASKDANEAAVMSDNYSADGVETEIVVTSDWDNLNSEKYYALTAGKYMSQEDAEIRLSEVKDLGYKDAYVKYTGTFIGESAEITITDIEATSCLSEYNMTHSAERIHDGKLEQAWVEGADGQGIGEAVTFYFDDYCVIHDLIINAGYQKTEELYYKNSRPQILKVYYSDGTAELIELSDIYGVQDIVLSNGSATNSLKLEIESVYEGNTYQDTVISEVDFN